MIWHSAHFLYDPKVEIVVIGVTITLDNLVRSLRERNQLDHAKLTGPIPPLPLNTRPVSVYRSDF